MLHKLTHLVGTQDNVYDIRNIWGTTLQAGSKLPPGKNKLDARNILGLKPFQAIDNADSYAWFALLRLRQQYCNIPSITPAERWSCLRITPHSKLWKFEWIYDKVLRKDVVQPMEPGCDNSCEQTVGSSNRNVRRTTETGKLCCPSNQVAYEKTDPKTKQVAMDCKCAPNFKQTGSGKDMKCALQCPKGSIKSKDIKCVKCPLKHTSNDNQTSCVVADDNAANGDAPGSGSADARQAELEAKLEELRQQQAHNQRGRTDAEARARDRANSSSPSNQEKPARSEPCRGKLCFLTGALDVASDAF